MMNNSILKSTAAASTSAYLNITTKSAVNCNRHRHCSFLMNTKLVHHQRFYCRSSTNSSSSSSLLASPLLSSSSLSSSLPSSSPSPSSSQSSSSSLSFSLSSLSSSSLSFSNGKHGYSLFGPVRLSVLVVATAAAGILFSTPEGLFKSHSFRDRSSSPDGNRFTAAAAVQNFRNSINKAAQAVRSFSSSQRLTSAVLMPVNHGGPVCCAPAGSAGGAGAGSAAKSKAATTTEEVDVGSIGNFDLGELYEVKLHGGKSQVLIANIDGKLYCCGNSCSHYSAPLHRGCPSKSGTVICPWHDAEFDLKTGRCIGGCGLKSIPTYPIETRDNRVYIRIPTDESEMVDSVDAPMATRDYANLSTIGIVGAGAAALAAAETLRQEGFTGRILMFGQEEYPPYDRPVLSKNFNAKIEKLALRSTEWLTEQAAIEFHPKTKIVKVDVKGKIIETSTGKRFPCEKILIATGGIPRRLPIPGSDLKNVETLRSFDDMQRLAPYAKLDQNVVVVGSSFIGMEVAATLAKGGAKVTVVGMEKTPFERVLGEKVGNQLAWLINQKKAVFKGGKVVSKFHGTRGAVRGVELSDGEVLQADLVVVGVGVSPNTEIVQGIEKLPDKSIQVNPFMQIEGCSDVYAAGDIATFPYYKTGENIRVEHWDVAMQQGRVAAKNMMGRMVPYDSIPFFWTMILGKSVRYAGYCVNPDQIIIEGSLEDSQYAAIYVKDDQIQAVATCGRDPTAVSSAELIRSNQMPSFVEYQMGMLNAEQLVHLAKTLCGKKI